MRLAALCGALLLSACATEEMRLIEHRHDIQMEQVRREMQLQDAMAQCRRYGFREGTDQYRNCLLQVDTANKQQAR